MLSSILVAFWYFGAFWYLYAPVSRYHRVSLPGSCYSTVGLDNQPCVDLPVAVDFDFSCYHIFSEKKNQSDFTEIREF